MLASSSDSHKVLNWGADKCRLIYGFDFINSYMLQVLVIYEIFFNCSLIIDATTLQLQKILSFLLHLYFLNIVAINVFDIQAICIYEKK